jgi:hypothetical protein
MNNTETLAAVIFLLFGAITVALGVGYGMGTAGALGPGALPVLAGGLLVLLGLLQLARALRAAAPAPRAFAQAELRPLLVILAAVAAFGLMIAPFGLIPALTALVLIAWFAQGGGRPVELAVILAVTLVLNLAIFHWGLGIPFRLFTWSL